MNVMFIIFLLLIVFVLILCLFSVNLVCHDFTHLERNILKQKSLQFTTTDNFKEVYQYK